MRFRIMLKHLFASDLSNALITIARLPVLIQIIGFVFLSRASLKSISGDQRGFPFAKQRGGLEHVDSGNVLRSL
jgi:hypothetical protein